MTQQYVHALALGLDPAWRRLPDVQRRSTCADFISTVEQAKSVTTYAYTMVGLQAGIDLVLWRLAPSLEALEESAAAALRCGMGTWMSVKESFLGLIQPSQYVKKPTPQEQSLFSGERSRYLIVYPFTKSADWYLLDKETRQRVMNEHMKVGHQYPQTISRLSVSSSGRSDPLRAGARPCATRPSSRASIGGSASWRNCSARDHKHAVVPAGLQARTRRAHSGLADATSRPFAARVPRAA